MSEDWRSEKAVLTWWATPSQSGLTRPYTAQKVADLRDTLCESHLSSAMGLKLRQIFTDHATNKTFNLSMCPMDSIQLQKMAEMGLDVAYVSGGVASMTSTSDPSTDHSDYTYNTVPDRVETLMRGQMLHARLGSLMGKETSGSGLLPLIADADSGVNLYTSVMKLVKCFVRAGAAGFHLDDLLPGAKRYDARDNEGFVCVPTNEMLRRITAARLQLDIMGSEALLIYRSDGHTSTRITSTIDHRDRPFILGASVAQEQEYASLGDSRERAVWKERAVLCTLDEAFREAHPDRTSEFTTKSTNLNTSAALLVAQELVPGFYWSADAARTSEGWYAYRGCIEASASRSLLASPLSDVVWSNSSTWDARSAERYAHIVHAVHPGKWLAYNITGGFAVDGSMDQEIARIPQLLADLGFVFQFLPLAGFTSSGLIAETVTRGLQKEGVLGYLNSVSRPAAQYGDDSSVEWWYKKMGRLTDAAADAVGTGF